MDAALIMEAASEGPLLLLLLHCTARLADDAAAAARTSGLTEALAMPGAGRKPLCRYKGLEISMYGPPLLERALQIISIHRRLLLLLIGGLQISIHRLLLLLEGAGLQISRHRFLLLLLLLLAGAVQIPIRHPLLEGGLQISIRHPLLEGGLIAGDRHGAVVLVRHEHRDVPISALPEWQVNDELLLTRQMGVQVDQEGVELRRRDLNP